MPRRARAANAGAREGGAPITSARGAASSTEALRVIIAARIDRPRHSTLPSVGGGGSSPPGVYLGGGRIVLAPGELRGAFAAASIGEPLPLEHQILNEAVAYAAAGHRRHAVISACSAAEVALSKSVRHLLDAAGRTEKEIAEVLKPARGVSELYRLNAARKGNLPVSLGHVVDRLGGPRNLAAHAGREPSEDTVRGSIQTARALLKVSPLPTPRSFRLPD